MLNMFLGPKCDGNDMDGRECQGVIVELLIDGNTIFRTCTRCMESMGLIMGGNDMMSGKSRTELEALWAASQSPHS